MLSFKPAFSLSCFTFIKRLFSFSLLSAIRVVSSAYQVTDISPRNLDSSLCFIQPGILHDALEKEMATHSSVLAWRIPAMGDPGGLPSMGSHRVQPTEAT